MAYIPDTTHITLLATLRRDRLLPTAGEVMAQVGQRVEATETVAVAYVPEEHRILDLAKHLEVPKNQTSKFMVKQDGDMVKKGELIAVRKTMMGLIVLPVASPVDGLLVASGDGRALVAAMSKPFELRAGLPGNVINRIEGRGVTIETTGALLQGVWGNGKDHYAVLRVLGSGPQDPLVADQVEANLRGTLLGVGTVQDDSAFKQIAEVGVAGLIIGSLKSDLLPMLRRLNIPVMVTDGFGAQGFSAPTYTLLVSNSGREIWLNAQALDRYAGARPEVIIPLPTPGQAPGIPAEGQPLNVGHRVRVLRGATTGLVGVVAALSDRLVTLPSGVRARVAMVKFEDANQPPASVAFANLEILE